MKATITTFPYGAAEGLPVLRIDFEGAAWSSDAAEAAMLRNAGARGLWGVWLDGLETWEDRDLDAWIDEQPRVVALRRLGEPDWPAAELGVVLDVSEAMQHAHSIDALAEFVSKHAHINPVVDDVIAVTDKVPPPAALDLLADFSQPGGQGYLYAPDGGGSLRPLFVRAISQCGSMWSLRSS